MWWAEQTDDMKKKVHTLVAQHRLELLSGGWSQNDEACTHYEDIINNMMVGHEFLKKEFNQIPTVGWQIDAYGHSNTNARLFAEMGFDAIFLNRIDFEDKA